MYSRIGKRLLDVSISFVAIILLSWLFAILALLILVDLGKPVLFRVVRPGLGEKPFTMLKFRTMSDARDKYGEWLPDADRLDRLGRFLRATSLDELPELWNVLRGDMSLVGPRPLSIKYLPFYTAEEKIRHDVKPGILGLAQVSGRNSLTWTQKFYYDVQYVQNVSLRVDLRIIFQGIYVVLSRKDIGQGEEQPVSLDDIRGDFRKAPRAEDQIRTKKPYIHSSSASIVVTGAGRFLGREIVRQHLLSLHAGSIHAVTREPQHLLDLCSDDRLKVISPERLVDSNIVNGSIVIHAAFPRVDGGVGFAEGLEATSKILENSVRSGARAIVNISSQSVYDPYRLNAAREKDHPVLTSPYATAKFASEILVEALCQNTQYLNVRLGSLVGIGLDSRVLNRFVQSAQVNHQLKVVGGGQKIEYLDVRDAAAGLLVLAELPEQHWQRTLNFGSGQHIFLLDVAKTVQRVAPDFVHQALRIEVEPADNRECSWIDSSDMYELISWRPRYSLSDTVATLFGNISLASASS